MEIALNMYQTAAIAMLLFVLGRFLTNRIAFLKRCCIPAPVVGGLIFAIVHLGLHVSGIVSFTFDSNVKDFFMTLFFTSVGYTACFRLLKKGGKKVITFLLVAISWEVITSDHVQLSPMYLTVQLVVCSIFLCDFVVRLSRADNRVRFFWRNLILLLISVPWLNIMVWSGMRPTHDWGLIVGLLPMLRAFLAMAFIVQWLVSDSKIQRLFIAYIFTVAVFTYISALVFYDYEIQVNPNLHNFGNALWWAWMNVTTVGAEIFPVTPIGKIFNRISPLPSR